MTVGRGDGGLCWRAVVGSDMVLRERGRAALVGGVLVRVLLLWRTLPPSVAMPLAVASSEGGSLREHTCAFTILVVP